MNGLQSDGGAPAPGDSAPRSPGAMVRAARERALLSQEELAANLRLSRGTLDALERDDYAALSEPVYIRGYYRKCARFLQLDEGAVVAAFDRMDVRKTPLAPTKLMLAKDAEGAEPAASLRPLVLILVFAIAVAALVWGIRYYAIHRQAAAGTTTTVGPAVPGAPAAVPNGDASQPAPSSSSLPAPPSAPSPLPPASGAAQSGSAAPQPAATPAPDAAATAPAAAAGSSGSRATSSTAAPAPAAMPPAVTPSTATAPASASAAGRAGGTPSADAAGASGGTLSLSVTKNCWVHIEDADGKLLLSRMAYPGNRFQLSGRAPYAVFLGYAPGVDLEYDGKPVDVSAHQRSNSTARLTVPAAAAQ